MNCAPSSQGLKDNELQPYINRAIEIAQKYDRPDVVARIQTLKIRFGDPGRFNFGACYYLLNEIVISRKSFIPLPNENREELIVHEIGHCAMGYEQHTEYGIMRASGLYRPEYYRSAYNFLMNDLYEDERFIQYDSSKYTQGKTMSKKTEILENDHTVVRFTAEWCGPCRTMKPIFEEIALANPTVKVYVIDVDKDPDTAVDFGVKGIPTLVKIVDKAEQIRTVGGQTKDAIKVLFVK